MIIHNLIVTDGDESVPKSEILRAHIAECLGFETYFRVNAAGDMIDAECDKVPPLEELLLMNPAMVGKALAWLADL